MCVLFNIWKIDTNETKPSIDLLLFEENGYTNKYKLFLCVTVLILDKCAKVTENEQQINLMAFVEHRQHDHSSYAVKYNKLFVSYVFLIFFM